jgi:transcription initiation factor TFIIIB Brf1 subunit/transcription initiation factor TFIIB
MSNDSYDQLDELSDDNLWDILDNFSNTKSDANINTKKCNECSSINLVYSFGHNSCVCSDCGLESNEVIEENSDWNNDDNRYDSNKNNIAMSAFFPKSSLGTMINIPGYSKIKMLRNWSHVPYKERSLAEVLNDIDNKCKKYKITKAVIDNAKILYKNIRETKHVNEKDKTVIIRGINRKQIIAACLYFGAILQKLPRSTKEIAEIFNLELKQITKGCRKFLEIMKDNYIVFDIKPFHGIDFVRRFGKKLKLSNQLLDLAEIIANNSTKLDLITDHQATSIAAASILLASIINNNKSNNISTDISEDSNYEEITIHNDLLINKKKISEIFNISDVTITKTYKKLLPFKDIIIDYDITNKFYEKINIEFFKDDIYIESLELDESDIIKKENIHKNRKYLTQSEKELKKIENKRLKEEVKLLKQQEKELNKIKKNQEKINNQENIIKKKRGRPKKIVSN